MLYFNNLSAQVDSVPTCIMPGFLYCKGGGGGGGGGGGFHLIHIRLCTRALYQIFCGAMRTKQIVFFCARCLPE